MSGSQPHTDTTWLVGIDIGGTFTDLVAVDAATGRQATAKVLTTPDDPGDGIIDALTMAAETGGVTLPHTSVLVHATTLAINTVIERTGARVGLLATSGFTDVLEMARANRHDMFDLQLERHPPLVERPFRVGVPERTSSAGEVLSTVDANSLEQSIGQLRDAGVESVAVCFLHAYKNPENEIRVRDHLSANGNGLPVSLSSDVAPVIREYERTLATVVNAYVAPRLSAYLSRLADAVRERGYAGEAHIMRSDGGWFSAGEASAYPVRILESGPAAGAIVAAAVAVQCASDLSVAFDMGGTTAKACLIVEGEPAITEELEVSRLERFKQGSGLPIRLPSVDLIEIGAGGGSIASVSSLGLLQIGPESAGAAPGPACYGRGGTQPTVTDADLVLGYLRSTGFAGGTMTLDLNAARCALVRDLVQAGVAEDETAAAWGVHDLVNENMALAMRMHCVEKGVHPGHVSIVATGGAGPVHATALMEKLGARAVICPRNVGVASALGLLLAPRTTERTLTHIVALAELTVDDLEQRLGHIADQIGAGANRGASVNVRRALRARLRGQGYEVVVSLPERVSSIDAVAAEFRDEYVRRFGRAPLASGQIEIVDWTVRLLEHSDGLPTSSAPSNAPRPAARYETRRAYWGPSLGWQDTTVLARDLMMPGTSVAGPAVFEEATSTIVVRPGQEATVDCTGNIVIRRSAAQA